MIGGFAAMGICSAGITLTLILQVSVWTAPPSPEVVVYRCFTATICVLNEHLAIWCQADTRKYNRINIPAGNSSLDLLSVFPVHPFVRHDRIPDKDVFDHISDLVT